MRRLLRILLVLAVFAGSLTAFAEFQLWVDEGLSAGWRLQRQLVTDRCRVLDPQDATVESGFAGGCEARFSGAVAAGASDQSRELLLLLHGLGRTPRMFNALGPELEAQNRQVLALRYPSLTRDIAEHGRWLNDLLNQLPGEQKISFVTHSLGGMVLRQALSEGPEWSKRNEIQRVVMLAPPNQGALIARALDKWTPLRWILGPSFVDLAGESSLPPQLPGSLELAIIAGGRQDDEGLNPFLPGDDDGVVRLEETRHPETRATLVVDALHTFIASNERVIAAIRSFVDDGRFPVATAQ